LFEAIVATIPPPKGDRAAGLQVLVTDVKPDAYLGPIAIGRVVNGAVREKQRVLLCGRGGAQKAAQVTALFVNEGLERTPVDAAGAGEIVHIAGMAGIGLGESIADAENPQPLPALAVDEPTLSMEFRINDSPFAGRE